MSRITSLLSLKESFVFACYPALFRAPARTSLWVVTLLFCSLFVAPTAASANAIRMVEIWARIHKDGAATITENWDISVTSHSNGEWRVARRNLDNMQISNLRVAEIGDYEVFPFQQVQSWDSSASQQDKSGKYALAATKDGVDIVWGFDTLGDHLYQISYTVSDLVKGYLGGDAICHNFLSKPAADVDEITIHIEADGVPMITPNVKAWVFGFRATPIFENDGVLVISEGRFRENEHATVLLTFAPSLLSPIDRRSKTLDELPFRRNADATSSENRNAIWQTPGALPFALLSFACVILLVVVALVHDSRSHKKGKLTRRRKDVRVRNSTIDQNGGHTTPCPDLPFEGSLLATYYRLCDLDRVKESDIIGAFLVKWFAEGHIGVVAKRAGFWLNEEDTLIQFRGSKPETPLEMELYSFLQEASGRDGMLDHVQLRGWAEEDGNRLDKWFSDCWEQGFQELLRLAAYEKHHGRDIFKMGLPPEVRVTAQGRDLTDRACGFKHFLSNREELPDSHLVFAYLLGSDLAAHPPDNGTRNVTAWMNIAGMFSYCMFSGYNPPNSKGG